MMVWEKTVSASFGGAASTWHWGCLPALEARVKPLH